MNFKVTHEERLISEAHLHLLTSLRLWARCCSQMLTMAMQPPGHARPWRPWCTDGQWLAQSHTAHLSVLLSAHIPTFAVFFFLCSNSPQRSQQKVQAGGTDALLSLESSLILFGFYIYSWGGVGDPRYMQRRHKHEIPHPLPGSMISNFGSILIPLHSTQVLCHSTIAPPLKQTPSVWRPQLP